MTTRADLLAAVLADPGDDLLRLAYADLCEEEGDDVRAGVIRWQVRHPEQHWSCERDEEVGMFCAPDSPCQTCHEIQPFPWRLCVDYRMRRGFVEEVCAPLRALLDHLPAALLAHPVTKLQVTDKRPHFVAGNYLWQRRDHSFGHATAMIDESVFDLLPGERYRHSTWLADNEEYANECLHAAVFAYARKENERRHAAGVA